LKALKPLCIICPPKAAATLCLGNMGSHEIVILGETSSSDASDLAFDGAPLVEPKASAAKIAYIMYTSGSTGDPKGVVVSQASAYACIQKIHQLVKTDVADRFTQFFELSFDLSISDIFLAWKSGACLYVPSFSELMIPVDFVVKQGITVWSSVPSLANNL